MKRLVTVATLAALMSPIVQATTLIGVGVPELSREAVAIVVGQVVALDASWTPDRRRIDTLVTLASERYVKGALGAEVQFVVPGGQIGRFRNVIVGAPQLGVGQRIVVFLGARGPSIPYVLGLSQGVFRVVPQDGGWVVTPLPVAGPDAAVRVVRGDPSRKPMPLDEFVREVRALAGAQP